MSTNRIPPTGTEILMIAQANPHIRIIEPTIQPSAPKPVRRKPRDLEHEEQVKLFEWAEQNLDRWNGVLAYMFAIPNAGKRSKRMGAYMVAEGLKAGVPDIFLPVASERFHGLFIEMKVRGNKPRTKQFFWLDGLRLRGYRVVVAYSATEAIAWIELYLDGKLPLDK